jgi:hypothetical protein
MGVSHKGKDKGAPVTLHGVELDPARLTAADAAMRRALRMPPVPHKPKTRPATKGRVHKGKTRS